MDRLIVFRTDSSEVIGTGHVMRCLTLAERIEKLLIRQGRKAKIIFNSQELAGNINHFIEQSGFKVFTGKLGEIVNNYERKINLLVVDHYELDYDWETETRSYVENILVIDDIANRRHDADALLDQNYNRNMTVRYQGLVPDDCQLFIGPRHMLFRDEFYDYRKIIDDRIYIQTKFKNNELSNEELRDKKLSNIEAEGKIEDKAIKVLVFYGGSDHTGETIKAIQAIQRSYMENVSPARDIKLKITVIVGAANQAARKIEKKCLDLNNKNKEKNINYEFYQQISNMAEVLIDSDLALGAGGVTMWERAYLGVPSIVTIIAVNQRLTTEAAAELGAIVNVGWYESVNEDNLVEAITSLIYDEEAEKRRNNLSQASLDLMDGDQEEKETSKENNVSLMDWIEEVLLSGSGKRG